MAGRRHKIKPGLPINADGTAWRGRKSNNDRDRVKVIEQLVAKGWKLNEAIRVVAQGLADQDNITEKWARERLSAAYHKRNERDNLPNCPARF